MANPQQSPILPGGPSSVTGVVDFFVGLPQFLRETWAELHRVQWPNRETIIKHTVIVVTVLVFLAIYVGGLDFIINRVFEAIGKLVGAGVRS